MDNAEIPPLLPRFAAGVPSERLLSSNLAALAACDLDLARRVAQARPDAIDGGVTVQAAASGTPTLSAGRLQVHSAFDPIAEAALQASRVPADSPRVMALGFGAGHLLATLLLRAELRRVDVVTLNASILRVVAAAVDLKPLLCDPRLRFVTDDKAPLSAPFVVVPPLLRFAEPARADLCAAATAALRKEAEGASQKRWTHA